jgi:predicted acyltransferase
MHQVLQAQEATVASAETVVTPKLRPLDNVTAVRNLAVDAYRGLVMLLMMGEVLQFTKVYGYYNHSLFWRILSFNQSHTEWSGCSVHDMIQPSFSFLVGVALPYSIRSRQRKGAGFPKMLAHTIWRSFLLIALGIFLRSINHTQTYYTFEDTLTQIGLGYTFLFLLAFRPTRDQWIAFGAILFGYWLAWALYPLPGPNFNYAAVGVPPDWHHLYTGFRAHWNKNSNLGQAFDLWFLNLFPRAHTFVFNEGGYLTLSFIPTLGTMILGLFAGQCRRRYSARRRRFSSLHRNLPYRQAHLDAKLDPLQWGYMLPCLSSVQLDHRREAAARLGLSPHRSRHKLDCRLPHCPHVGGVYQEQSPHQSGPKAVLSARPGTAAPAAWRRDAVHLLALPLVDVPAQNLPPHMRIHSSIFANGVDRETEPDAGFRQRMAAHNRSHRTTVLAKYV